MYTIIRIILCIVIRIVVCIINWKGYNMILSVVDALEEHSKMLSTIADYEVKDEKLQKMLNDIAYKLYLLSKDLEEMVS